MKATDIPLAMKFINPKMEILTLHCICCDHPKRRGKILVYRYVGPTDVTIEEFRHLYENTLDRSECFHLQM